jgi:dihydrolipoamide dehydrogenase
VTGGLLGVEMVGPQSEHLAHLLAWCIQMQLSVAQILAFPFYHPVFEEGVRGALQHALGQLDPAPGSGAVAAA